MIEVNGKVVAVDCEVAWVETRPQTACAKCASGEGCGQGVFTQLLGKRFVHIKVHSVKPLSVGQSVVIGIGEHAIVDGALLVYGLPLVGTAVAMLLSAWLSSWVGVLTGWQDLLVGIGGIGGFFLSHWGVQRVAARMAANGQLNAKVLRTLGDSVVVHSP